MMEIEKIGNDVIENDHLLNEREAEEVQSTVVEAFQNVATARGLLPVRQISEGSQFYVVNKTDFTEDEEEGIIGKMEEYPGITVDGEEIRVRIAKMGRSFQIAREDLQASRERGQSLDTSTAASASTAVGQSESYLIMQGSQGIPGLFDSANDETSSGATNGWDDDDVNYDQVESDLESTVNNLPDAAQNREMTLVLPRSEYNWLRFNRTSNDRTFLELVREHVDNIEWNSYVPSGTALLKAEGRDIAEYVIAEEMEVVAVSDGDETSNDAFEWKVRLRASPVVKKRAGLEELTGI